MTIEELKTHSKKNKSNFIETMSRRLDLEMYEAAYRQKTYVEVDYHSLLSEKYLELMQSGFNVTINNFKVLIEW